MSLQIILTLGIVVAQAINLGTQHIAGWGWRVSLGCAGIPAIVLTAGGLLLPDTPNSLIDRGHEEEGKQVHPPRHCPWLESFEKASLTPCHPPQWVMLWQGKVLVLLLDPMMTYEGSQAPRGGSGLLADWTDMSKGSGKLLMSSSCRAGAEGHSRGGQC